MQNMPNEIKVFLEKLLVDKGMNNLTPGLKQEMTTSLYSRLMAYILTDIAKEVDEETSRKINDLFESGQEKSMEQIQQFLKDNVKNIEEIIAKSMLEFRNVYLSN